MKAKRPFLVTTLVLLVLSFTIVSWFGFFEALQHWTFIHQLPLLVSPVYLLLRGAFWGLVGIPLIWGLWFGYKWAWIAGQGICFGYAAFYWLDELVLATQQALTARLPFKLGTTVFGLIFCFGVLWLPAGREYFDRATSTESS